MIFNKRYGYVENSRRHYEHHTGKIEHQILQRVFVLQKNTELAHGMLLHCFAYFRDGTFRRDTNCSTDIFRHLAEHPECNRTCVLLMYRNEIVLPTAVSPFRHLQINLSKNEWNICETLLYIFLRFANRRTTWLNSQTNRPLLLSCCIFSCET